MGEVKQIENITDVFKAAWVPNLSEQDAKVYYLRGVNHNIEVTHLKNSSGIMLKCFSGDKETPWFINKANLCSILQRFSGLLSITSVPQKPNETHSFSFKLASGQINFVTGTLKLRAVTDFDAFVKELAKLDHLFEV